MTELTIHDEAAFIITHLEESNELNDERIAELKEENEHLKMEKGVLEEILRRNREELDAAYKHTYTLETQMEDLLKRTYELELRNDATLCRN